VCFSIVCVNKVSLFEYCLCKVYFDIFCINKMCFSMVFVNEVYLSMVCVNKVFAFPYGSCECFGMLVPVGATFLKVSVKSDGEDCVLQ
jgi:hypothetical protein